MFGTDTLLERFDKILHNLPSYYLSSNNATMTHRAMYSTSNYQMLQENVRRIAEHKIKKNATPLRKIRLKSCVGSPRKHHYLELIQPYQHKVHILELKNISINSSKANITRQGSNRISGYFSRSPQRSPRARHITINIPTAMQN